MLSKLLKGSEKTCKYLMIGDRPCPYYMLHTMKNLKSQTLQLLSEKR